MWYKVSMTSFSFFLKLKGQTTISWKWNVIYMIPERVPVKCKTYMEFSFEQLWLFLDVSYTVHKVYAIVKKVHPAFNLAAPLLQECTGSTTKEGSSQTFCLLSSYSWAASWKKTCPFPVHRDFPVCIYLVIDFFLGRENKTAVKV